MKQKYLILFGIGLLCVACTQQKEITAQTVPVDQVIENVDGALAYETTAYVEKYWRVVGNSGFDSSIYFVVNQLEKVGYIEEAKASPSDKLTYRLEKRVLGKPTWEPVDATATIEGESTPLLKFSSNRNMIAMHSHSADLTAEVVKVDDVKNIPGLDVKGKIVYAETHPFYIYQSAVVDGGALGIMTYNMPSYLQPEKNTTSIQFRSIPMNEEHKSWGIMLSYEAKQRLEEALAEGTVELNVNIDTKIYASEELTVVADVKGSQLPEERLVFSAHVQEPGANDNASGVGVALEMAAVTADLIKNNELDLARSLTFLWGDEIVSTKRYVEEDKSRAEDIRWGISLDMVGENTAVTGGSFLIEKMPDPSAIWTRGKDEHTEWGAAEMTLEDMQPHYLNDFVTHRFMEQGERANWKVKTNPFEGGSDHVPFLRADIPGVLFWHFTDQFYHTDNDRIDKVSKTTLENVGTAALISAYTLVNANAETAKNIIEEVRTAALSRLDDELGESKQAISNGASVDSQIEIIKAWEDWYLKALDSTKDMVSDESNIQEAINSAKSEIKVKTESHVKALNK